jgi:hypothetical protein
MEGGTFAVTSLLVVCVAAELSKFFANVGVIKSTVLPPGALSPCVEPAKLLVFGLVLVLVLVWGQFLDLGSLGHWLIFLCSSLL